MTISRRGFPAATGAMLWSTGLGASTGDLVQIEGPAFGASWRVGRKAGVDAPRIGDAMMKIIAEIDQALSPYLPQSEISRFSRTQTREWLPLGPSTLATLAEAKHIASLTGGAFDPTLGGIVGRYGFGPMMGTPAGAFADMDVTDAGAEKGASEADV